MESIDLENNLTEHDKETGTGETPSSIISSQMGSMVALTGKIEAEMSQVWRQIDIMYNQLTANKDSLDKLKGHTERYVNGSVATMENMEEKVGLITTRVTEVNENLNHLLGRLSLVAQEFTQIRNVLGEALEKANSNLLAVQSRLNKSGNPHDIESDARLTSSEE